MSQHEEKVIEKQAIQSINESISQIMKILKKMDKKFTSVKRGLDVLGSSVDEKFTSVKREHDVLRSSVRGLKVRRSSLPEIETTPDGGVSGVLSSWPIRPGY